MGICFLILICRFIDMFLGTVRMVFVSRGQKYHAFFLGLIESLFWITAISRLVIQATDWRCYLAWALGFALGSVAGMFVIEWISKDDIKAQNVVEGSIFGFLMHKK